MVDISWFIFSPNSKKFKIFFHNFHVHLSLSNVKLLARRLHNPNKTTCMREYQLWSWLMINVDLWPSAKYQKR